MAAAPQRATVGLTPAGTPDSWEKVGVWSSHSTGNCGGDLHFGQYLKVNIRASPRTRRGEVQVVPRVKEGVVVEIHSGLGQCWAAEVEQTAGGCWDRLY